MTRAILVNTEHNYVAYGHQKYENNESFEVEPHATIQALIKAKREEIAGGTLFVWRYPCYECAKAIVYAGIRKIVYKHDDHADPTRSESQLLFEHSDVEVVRNEDLDF